MTGRVCRMALALAILLPVQGASAQGLSDEAFLEALFRGFDRPGTPPGELPYYADRLPTLPDRAPAATGVVVPRRTAPSVVAAPAPVIEPVIQPIARARAAPRGVGVRVFFASGSAALDPRTIEGLAQACRVLPRLPAYGQVEVVGHTDRSGPASVNDRLSARRALAVRAYLVSSCAVPAASIVAYGAGERFANQRVTDATDRRVEFRFTAVR